MAESGAWKQRRGLADDRVLLPAIAGEPVGVVVSYSRPWLRNQSDRQPGASHGISGPRHSRGQIALGCFSQTQPVPLHTLQSTRGRNSSETCESLEANGINPPLFSEWRP